MLAQIKHARGDIQNVDLRDYNNLKAFLYFEKVLRYGDKYWKVLGRTEGTIDERAEVFGRYYQDLEALKEKATNFQVCRNLPKRCTGVMSVLCLIIMTVFRLML